MEQRGEGRVVSRRFSARRLVAGIPALWLTVFFLVPFLIVLKISFSEARLAIPPYAPLITWLHGLPVPSIHLSGYAYLFTDPLYLRSYLYSVMVAAVSTLFCLLIGYPMAYAIARAGPTRARSRRRCIRGFCRCATNAA